VNKVSYKRDRGKEGRGKNMGKEIREKSKKGVKESRCISSFNFPSLLI